MSTFTPITKEQASRYIKAVALGAVRLFESDSYVCPPVFETMVYEEQNVNALASDLRLWAYWCGQWTLATLDLHFGDEYPENRPV